MRKHNKRKQWKCTITEYSTGKNSWRLVANRFWSRVWGGFRRGRCLHEECPAPAARIMERSLWEMNATGRTDLFCRSSDIKPWTLAGNKKKCHASMIEHSHFRHVTVLLDELLLNYKHSGSSVLTTQREVCRQHVWAKSILFRSLVHASNSTCFLDAFR